MTSLKIARQPIAAVTHRRSRLHSGRRSEFDFVSTLGSRLWERGRQGIAPRLSVSLPAVVRRDGLLVSGHARSIDVPLVVRNAGDSAAGGIAVSLRRPVKGDSPVLSTGGVEVHIPWLSDAKLEGPSSTVVSCSVEVDPERISAFSALTVSIQTSWLGGQSAEVLELPLAHADGVVPRVPVGRRGEWRTA